MTHTYLLKPAELALKGGNRAQFERVLCSNLAQMLKGSGACIHTTNGRIFVHCADDAAPAVEDVLRHLAGISGWAKAGKCDKTLDAVLELAVCQAQRCAQTGARTFKVEARRTDKSFPLNSYEICCAAGERICAELPALAVDVHKPDANISIEIREHAYIYGARERGLGGLPAGTAARGLLLLSGGIDSPVAGYLMALRGMRFSAVYFHAYPYTSNEALDKVLELARLVGRYSMGVKLHVVSFTQVEQSIKDGAPEAWRTVLLRMAMMDCATRLARRTRCKALITGESLSQVASQTVENITCTQSLCTLPVLRPLIGMDKESIIRLAQTIGTYQTSIQPYPDCCTLFAPPHPVLRATLDQAQPLYHSLNLNPLIDAALQTAVKHAAAARV